MPPKDRPYPEPWRPQGKHLLDRSGRRAATASDPETARRIAACVNALPEREFDTECLERGIVGEVLVIFKRSYERLRKAIPEGLEHDTEKVQTLRPLPSARKTRKLRGKLLPRKNKG